MLNEREGLRFKEWQEEKLLFLDTERLEQCIEFAGSAEGQTLTGIVVSRDLGFASDSLSDLRHFSQIRGLKVADGFSDYSSVLDLKNLQILHLSENNASIQLDALPEIRDLSVDWNKKIEGLSELTKLERITVGKFNPKVAGLGELPSFQSLKSLELIRSNIHSTEGIGKQRKLSEVRLSYCPKLTDVSSLTRLQLKLGKL